jgi:hypothetical protein
VKDQLTELKSKRDNFLKAQDNIRNKIRDVKNE